MDGLFALLQVIMIDIILAGDNALVIGALSAHLPADRRTKAVALGIGAAIVIRLFFTATAAWLMIIPAIGLIGGLLLLWIAYKLWKEQQGGADAPDATASPTSFATAVRAIVLADISMSLDNILGVAGAAKGHAFALIVGLVLSMVIMGTAANWIAGQMSKRPWLIYLGIGAIVLAGIKMIVEAF